MNQKMKEKISAGILIKIDYLLKSTDININPKEIQNLLQVRNETVAFILIEKLGIKDYDEKNIILSVNDKLFCIQRKVISDLINKDIEPILFENKQIYLNKLSSNSISPDKEDLCEIISENKYDSIKQEMEKPQPEIELENDQISLDSEKTKIKTSENTTKNQGLIKQSKKISKNDAFSSSFQDIFDSNSFDIDLNIELKKKNIIKKDPIKTVEDSKKVYISDEDLLNKFQNENKQNKDHFKEAVPDIISFAPISKESISLDNRAQKEETISNSIQITDKKETEIPDEIELSKTDLPIISESSDLNDDLDLFNSSDIEDDFDIFAGTSFMYSDLNEENKKEKNDESKEEKTESEVKKEEDILPVDKNLKNTEYIKSEEKDDSIFDDFSFVENDDSNSDLISDNFNLFGSNSDSNSNSILEFSDNSSDIELEKKTENIKEILEEDTKEVASDNFDLFEEEPKNTETRFIIDKAMYFEDGEENEEEIIKENTENDDEKCEYEYLYKNKKERQNILINLLLEKDESKNDGIINNTENASNFSIYDKQETAEDNIIDNSKEDNYKFDMKLINNKFNFTDINKNEYVADIYEFNFKEDHYKICIFPLNVPKKDKYCKICMYIESPDNIAIEISKGNLNIASTKIGKFNFFASASLVNKHFVSKLNMNYDGNLIENVIKKKIRPEKQLFGGLGHNIVRIGVANTFHVFPLSMDGNNNSSIVILKKDYDINKINDVFYTKSGHLENINTDDGDYTIDTFWENGIFKVRTTEKEIVRRKETIF